MPDKPKKKRYMVIFDPDVFEAISKIAKAEDRSASYLTNRLWRAHLQAQGLLPKDVTQ